MIEIKCSTPDKVLLTDMTPFQGELKKRTEQVIKDLSQSLVEDGLLMPFAIWKSDKNYILDGHGRMQALVRLALDDARILEQEYPVIVIEAETEDDARKALLQITSTYGRFNKAAVLEFAKPVINYRAPVLNTAVERKPRVETKAIDRVILRLGVAKDKVKQLTSLLKEVEGVEIL